MANGRFWICAAALSLAWPGVAIAQDGFGFAMILPTATRTDVLSMHLQDVINKAEARRGPQRSQARAAPPAAAAATPRANPLPSLRYTPSKARRSANLAAFVKKSDPAGARSLQELYAGGDIIERMGQAMAGHGLRVDNVADAYAAWWTNAWLATRGRKDELDRATLIAVRDQAARALGEMPEYMQAGDAPKQELAEALLIQAVLIEGALSQAEGDERRLREVGTAVNQGAARMGLDLMAMDLTEGGFVAR